MTGKDIPMLNENFVINILTDVDFLDQEFQRNGRPQLMTAFAELRMVRDSSKTLSELMT
jgi:exocyst complex component 6